MCTEDGGNATQPHHQTTLPSESFLPSLPERPASVLSMGQSTDHSNQACGFKGQCNRLINIMLIFAASILFLRRQERIAYSL